MGRAPCCDKVGLKKGPWTPEEDQKLISYIQEHGHGSWRALPQKAGLLRCGKSCRLRWANYLRPDIKRGKFTPQEEQTIIQLHALLGNRWSAIATHLPKRTDNEIKNYWNTHLKKRLIQMGIDPVTHKPKVESLNLTATSSASSVSHMAQWESARLEAESRLVRESKLRAKGLWPPRPQTSAPKLQTAAELSARGAVPSFRQQTEPLFTSYVGLLQQAMCCPNAMGPAIPVPRYEAEGEGDSCEEQKPAICAVAEPLVVAGTESVVCLPHEVPNNCSSASSEISEVTKGGNDASENVLNEFQQIHNEEITSSTSAFSSDSLLDLVVCLPTSHEETEDDHSKDYWCSMFSICNSPSHCNHSSVHSIFSS